MHAIILEILAGDIIDRRGVPSTYRYNVMAYALAFASR